MQLSVQEYNRLSVRCWHFSCHHGGVWQGRISALVAGCYLSASVNAQLGTVRRRRQILPHPPWAPGGWQRAGTISGCVGSPALPSLPEEVFTNSRLNCARGVRVSPGLAQEPVCKTRCPFQVPRGCLPAAAAMDLFLTGLRCCCFGCKGARSSTPDILVFTSHREGLICCPCLTFLIFT